MVRAVVLFEHIIKNGECWEWKGGRTKNGYGTHRGTTAHRCAYEAVNGVIPAGMVVMHTCDNPPCINPAHLKLGTQQENLADMHRKGRAGDCRNFGEKHGRCKLKTEDVAAIRAEYAKGGVSQWALAHKYGIKQTQVSRIIRGEARTLN